MRLILLLIDILLPCLFFFFIGSFLYGIYHVLIKKRALKKWYKRHHKTNIKRVQFKDIASDMQEFNLLIKNRVPKKTQAYIKQINEHVQSLTQQDMTFDKWKENHREQSQDLLDIIYQHMPESLNRYFQLSKPNDTANAILDSTYAVFLERIEHIAQDAIDARMSQLRTYNTYIKSKYEEGENYLEK